MENLSIKKNVGKIMEESFSLIRYRPRYTEKELKDIQNLYDWYLLRGGKYLIQYKFGSIENVDLDEIKSLFYYKFLRHVSTRQYEKYALSTLVIRMIRYVIYDYKPESYNDDIVDEPYYEETKGDDYSFLLEIIKSLPKNKQYIINKRFGFDGDKKTLEEIGNHFKVSKEAIRQNQNKAIRFLKEKVLIHKDKLKGTKYEFCSF